MMIIFPVYILSTVKNPSMRKILDPSDFISFGFNGFLAYGIFVYTSSMVRDGTSAKHIFTSFCAVSTHIWTSAHMGYNAVSAPYVRRHQHIMLR